MDWLMIVGFILFGIILIVVEIVFVPGTTIVGIGGFVCVSYGIYLTFMNHGTSAGYITLGSTALVSIAVVVYSLKSKSWEKLALNNTMEGKFNDEFEQNIQVGDLGESASSLKPIGKAIFNEQEIEVRTMGEYIREKCKLRVVKIEHKKIFVEPITES